MKKIKGLFNFYLPRHIHFCPGVKSKHCNHEEHEYKCWSPICNGDKERYCRIIVDALINNNHKSLLNKKFI